MPDPAALLPDRLPRRLSNSANNVRTAPACRPCQLNAPLMLR